MFYVPETTQRGLSRTALGVCAFCAMVNRNPAYRDVFYDPFAERLFAEGAVHGQRILDGLTDWPSVLTFADEKGIARRLIASVLWRKTFMQSRAEQAMADGAQQIVVLGSGLDTIGLRLFGSYSQVPVFEVDRPETIDAKRMLISQNFGVPPNIRYTAVDFARETTLKKLLELGYDHNAGTVFIAEVSLEYVPPAEVAEVYQMVRSNRSRATRFLTSFAFTASVSQSMGESDDIGNAVAGAGEPFLFNVAPEEVSDFATEQGFSVLEHLYGSARIGDYVKALGLSIDALDFPIEQLDASSFSLCQLKPH
ncbi:MULTISPECIES: SAM-dependent methyltransferase [unclassified Ruegeria]|uniref:class I SAM-dependent methyltransferase n=1 Tax=unclassified Ruegeria TaxID=2625375 RepID=UPI001487DBF7|nr:SAM-dependent methyltransferase [Ruegeria sp. HKCCD4332]NOD95122.1 SAM-dependent methyltransferase [Ruegeria sp. HKCCD4884]